MRQMLNKGKVLNNRMSVILNTRQGQLTFFDDEYLSILSCEKHS